MMSSDFLHPSWRFSSDLVGFSKQRTRNRLKMLASRKTMLDTCSIQRRPLLRGVLHEERCRGIEPAAASHGHLLHRGL